jgi:L-iditol 2-dehydrogenase
MKAIKLFGTGQLACVDIEPPKPKADEVLVKIEAAGICGTDRHLYKGEYPSTAGSTLGHEFCGIIVDRGNEVSLPIGARVTCDPNIWCGDCDQCRRGRVNLCRHNRAIGIQIDGGFAEYCAFPASKAHLLPPDLHPHDGAFCEPLACTLHGMDLAAIRVSERVLVLGGGVIGLLAVQLARLARAETMLMTRNPTKQRIGQETGAQWTATNEEDVLRQWPEGADVVLECAGVAATMTMAPRLTRTGGRVVILGVLARGEKIAIEPFDLLVREVNILFAFINPFTQERAARLISEGHIKVRPLITRCIGIEDGVDAIRSSPPDGDIRCLILPNG